jgi:hypothetical protein
MLQQGGKRLNIVHNEECSFRLQNCDNPIKLRCRGFFEKSIVTRTAPACEVLLSQLSWRLITGRLLYLRKEAFGERIELQDLQRDFRRGEFCQQHR